MSCVNCGHEYENHINDSSTATGSGTNCNAVMARNIICVCRRYQEKPAKDDLGYSEEYVKYFNEYNNIYNKPKKGGT